jgi:hypothetical protein
MNQELRYNLNNINESNELYKIFSNKELLINNSLLENILYNLLIKND